jgi:hypothetical protein
MSPRSSAWGLGFEEKSINGTPSLVQVEWSRQILRRKQIRPRCADEDELLRQLRPGALSPTQL